MRRLSVHRTLFQPLLACAWLGTSLGMVSPAVAEETKPLDFNRDIRPILSDKCFACHGLDEKKREADLRLDDASGAVSGAGGRVIVPGDPQSSVLWERIVTDNPDEVMPPPESNKSLDDREKNLIRRWIEQGAEYRTHWSFEPVRVAAVPEVMAMEHPIDRFLAARLAEKGWSFNEPATDAELIRRVAMTLTGLPPTLEQLEAFRNDGAPGAYERMVERFLDHPAYGEEMARHWLDVARYADTHGLHLDNERQTWAYRDWVVRAFNTNLPFDQFTIEQLAGDLLPSPTVDQLIATGFNRCNVTTSEGGSIDAEFHFRYAVDRASTTMQTWMGLTGGCAVCHDHKFDPISQKEFYSFYAFFYSAADPAMDGNALLTAPVVQVKSTAVEKGVALIDRQLAELDRVAIERAQGLEYIDPAKLNPPPQPMQSTALWLDEGFIEGGKLTAAGAPLQITDASQGPVFAGGKSVKRKEGGLGQDVWESTGRVLKLPQEPVFTAQVWIDPNDLPKAIMLQYFKGGWNHRAVWGDYEIIPWGAPQTPERFAMGGLPEAGKWIELKIPADKLGLKAGDEITGFAVTQHGGTVYWDAVGVEGRIDPASDPEHSMSAWFAIAAKQPPAELPERWRALFAKSWPDAQEVPSDELEGWSAIRAYYLKRVCAQTKDKFQDLNERSGSLTQQKMQLLQSQPSTFVFRDLDQPRQANVMMRGAYDKPGEAVEPAGLKILPPVPLTTSQPRLNRLDLARWLVAPDHPLTARVTVNRFWQQVFGVGLVKSSGDFGSQGEVPSHPELLDWLAWDFQSNGWDIKRLMRQLLTSEAFRQSAKVSQEKLSGDPENRLLSRGPRIRLDAEQLRDQALFASGLIDMEMGGKGVKPYQPPNIWEPVGFVGSNTRFYQEDQGAALYRRSLYTFIKRTAPAPFMINFDAPNREQSCTRRERSNTPLQALQLMNDVQHVEAARMLAQRILLDLPQGSSADRLELATKLLLARAPSPKEVQVLTRQLENHLMKFRQDVPGATALVSVGKSMPSDRLDKVELAAWTMVANTLLNLDETISRN
ncbi:MAG: PSD1 and planctomycete cytochrome C domain-containing protein [Pirellulaceae bacterium]